MTVIQRPTDNRPGDFRQSLAREFDAYLARQSKRFAPEDVLRVDLHCHDLNSDTPDELWGRILNLPESWLKTRKLVKCLKRNGCDVITITNHNNARSCWALLEQGHDVLVGAEFTCYFPEADLYLHVLTYGFSPAQEAVLQAKRQNVYDFLRYAAQHNIPVVLPHPLYFYTRNQGIDLALFEKLAVMFQRFEVLNGQRDLWQSTLTLNWVQTLTPEKIQHYARKHKLDPRDFGVDPYAPKALAGGSDDHMGLFAGHCGTQLMIPDLQQRLLTDKPSELALEAIRAGAMAPYGNVAENQKLSIALLDYFSQIATRIKDPGLLRILLHRGDATDKLACFALSNALLELQENKQSRKFFEFVHDALQGKKPNRMLKWKVSKKYRFCIAYLEKIADSRQTSPEQFARTVTESIAELFTELNRVIIRRVQDSALVEDLRTTGGNSVEDLTRRFEVPSQVTAWLAGSTGKSMRSTRHCIGDLADKLSFPVMIAAVLAGANLASTRALYKNRGFLNEFAAHLGRNHHTARALHLTDTLYDKNGVSNSLTGKLRQIQRNELGIDMLVCHESAAGEPHLHVIRPLASFTLPDSGGQPLRIPDLLHIARIFYEGGYDRVICSTEGPMAAAALFLKYMFNVPCYFFMHTDWIEYIKCTTQATQHERDRIRRILRLLYSQFDGIFVLNREHRDWLAGFEMQLDRSRIFLTAHHAPQVDTGVAPVAKRELFSDATEDTPVLFIACRLSAEKGILDLPEIMALARQSLPELKLVIAGSGPAEGELKALMPEAKFMGWVDKQTLASLYAGLDLFVFPSRFDTFGNVLLEAFAHGMPAIAYDCKGPRDIIEPGASGYLVETIAEMADQIVAHFRWPDRRTTMRAAARQRASYYSAERIMGQYLEDLGLPGVATAVAPAVAHSTAHRSVA
jgi:glycosyltransferase involved in cell wall biosynthesis